MTIIMKDVLTWLWLADLLLTFQQVASFGVPSPFQRPPPSKSLLQSFPTPLHNHRRDSSSCRHYSYGVNYRPPFLLRTQLFSSSQANNSENDNEGEDFVDMEQLRNRMERQQNAYIELIASADEEGPRPELVYIILFNPGAADQGVHTIEFPKGSGYNILLAFESLEECVHFSRMLKQDVMYEYDPIPSPSELEQLEEFCRGIGLPVKVVPEGKNLNPPSDVVEELSMDPNIGKERSKLDQMFELKDASGGGNPKDDSESNFWQ